MATLATCTTSGTDYAEAYGTTGSIPDGTIVMNDESKPVQTVPDPNRPGKTSTKAYAEIADNRNKSIGVISTNPSIEIIGESLYDTEPFQPVGLTGRVPVRVNDENGSISAGDAIMLSSVPGVGAKATSAGKIVGYAISGFSGSGEGMVTMFISNSYYNPLNGQQALQAQSVETGSLNVSGMATVQNLTVTGAATIGTLTVTGDAEIEGTLTVETIKVVDIEISGHVITVGGAPTNEVLTAAGQNATVEVKGNDTLGTISVTTGNNPAIGDLSKIMFNKDYGLPPRVLLSPANDKSADLRFYRGTTDKEFFMLTTNTAPLPNTTYVFDYFIGQAKD